MKVNIRHLDGPLLWTMWGTVWATFEITPLSAAFPSREQESTMLRTCTAVLRQLPREWLLKSVCERLPPAEIVAGMIDGVDIERCSAWRDIAAATLKGLAELPLYRRRHFISIELSGDDWRTRTRLVAGTVASDLFRWVSLPEVPVERAQVKRFRNEAATFLQKLNQVLGSGQATPVNERTHRWLYERAPQLGADEPRMPERWSPRVSWSDETPTATGRMEPLQHIWRKVSYREGGSKDDPGRLQHQYLRIAGQNGDSYQILGAISGLPLTFSYPEGGKWWLLADEFNVDWTCRGMSVPNSHAQARVRWQHRQLLDQTEQWAADPAGSPRYIVDAIEGINAEQDGLTRNPSDPELQAGLIFAMGGTNLEQLERDWGEFASAFRNAEWPVDRPTGGQQQLFQAMLPGYPVPPTVRDYMQFFLPGDLAAGLPFAGTDLGDPTGMLFGFSGAKPVLLNERYATDELNKSGSMLFIADSGGGKTYAIKTVMHAAVARGCQVVTLDCSDIGEYADFAAVTPGRSQVVTVEPGADLSLDPMRVFAGRSRRRFTQMFFSHLTRVDPTDDDGAALSKAINAAVRREKATSVDVLDALHRIAEDGRDRLSDAAAKLYSRVVNIAEQTDLADLVFDRERCVLGLDADYICFHAPHLDLPKRVAFKGEGALGRLLPEQVISQALFYLIAAYEREITWSSERLAMWVQDEEWRFERTEAGQVMIDEGLREGRKHKAIMLIATQLASDPRPEIVALVNSILLLRQAEGTGHDALALIGRDRDDRDLVAMVESFEPGEGLLRDSSQRVGRLSVPRAADHLHLYFSSNPKDIAARKTEMAGRVAVRAATAPRPQATRPVRPQPSDAGALDDRSGGEPTRPPSSNRRRKRRPPHERRATQPVPESRGEAAFG